MAVLLPALLLGLTACGGDDGEDDEGVSRLDAVSISGDPGTAPEVSWKDRMSAGKVEVEVLVEGDGPEVKTGEDVQANIWVGNGYSQQETWSTYAEGGAQSLTVDEEQLAPVFVEALEGHPRGSRVAVTASAEEAFGETGNPGLGIGNKDAVLLVVDIADQALAAPQGAKQKAPAWAPKITTNRKGLVSGLDFAGTPEPSDKLRTAYLVKGEGAKVAKGQSVTVDYLGQVYGAKKPFDQSYGKKPMTTQIGVGAVVPGWDQGLVGVPVGSRVLLAIPPKLGYGEKGQKDAGIKGTDTLYFVVDVLGAI
ncbi:FKBP-type peptidyl-prolyl cis-trans isomerase [Nocardioides pantholopis]|uniref:FKBP-type peptidyl-prolyl cis-trans isomerase n=1 Tax=Nocardioides pantholopis TaxID=2483798 RepID=UPI000F0918A0|nr:FKBP-type peptidyl-prolyl cis-trans isomerase [Nocardioides pantholopis]